MNQGRRRGTECRAGGIWIQSEQRRTADSKRWFRSQTENLATISLKLLVFMASQSSGKLKKKSCNGIHYVWYVNLRSDVTLLACVKTVLDELRKKLNVEIVIMQHKVVCLETEKEKWDSHHGNKSSGNWGRDIGIKIWNQVVWKTIMRYRIAIIATSSPEIEDNICIG